MTDNHEKFIITDDGTLTFAAAYPEMIIPDNVKKIAKGAIIDSPQTESIYIPAEVEEIEECAISFLHKLQKIEVHPNNKRYKSIDNCLVDMQTKTLLLSNCTRHIPNDKNVENIVEWAFTGGRSVVCKEIIIPSFIKSLNASALHRIHGDIERIEVDKNNKTYRSCDNCVIDIAKKQVVAICTNAKIPTDGSVTSIGDGAYLGCDGDFIFIPPYITEVDIEKIFRLWPVRKCNILIDKKANVELGNLRGKGVRDPSLDGYRWNGVFPESYSVIDKSNAIIENGVLKKYTATAVRKWYGYGDLANLYIPSGIEKIAEGAFENHTELKRIIFGKDVKEIALVAFGGCANLKCLEVVGDNPILHSAGNCIIRTAEKKLLLGCSQSEIPDDGSVTAIGEGAFYGCVCPRIRVGYASECLSAIVIPDGVTHIGDKAFYGCKPVNAIYLPTSLKYIGKDAFGDCSNRETPTEIAYGGSMKELLVNTQIECNWMLSRLSYIDCTYED